MCSLCFCARFYANIFLFIFLWIEIMLNEALYCLKVLGSFKYNFILMVFLFEVLYSYLQLGFLLLMFLSCESCHGILLSICHCHYSLDWINHLVVTSVLSKGHITKGSFLPSMWHVTSDSWKYFTLSLSLYQKILGQWSTLYNVTDLSLPFGLWVTLSYLNPNTSTGVFSHKLSSKKFHTENK